MTYFRHCLGFVVSANVLVPLQVVKIMSLRGLSFQGHADNIVDVYFSPNGK